MLSTVILGRTLDCMIEVSEKQIIDQVAGRLAASYQQVEPAQVDCVVLEEYSRFEGKRIRDFVPLFVERHAKDELAKLGAADPPQRETVV